MNIKKLFTFLFALLISCFSSVALALTPTGYSPTVPQALCRTATNSWTFCNGADVFGAGTTMTSPVLNSPVINNPSGALFNNPTLYSSYIESKGGVYNGDLSYIPTFVAEQTGINWIDGSATGSSTDSKSGFYFYPSTGDATARITDDGKIKTTLINGGSGNWSHVTTLPAFTSGGAVTQKNLIPVKPSTTYRISYTLKTIGASDNSFKVIIKPFNGLTSLQNLPSPSLGVLPTIEEEKSYTATTGATTDSVAIGFIQGDTLSISPGNSGQIIYISNIRLEEISSLIPTNTLPETLLPIVQSQISQSTDQSQLNTNEVRAFGNDTRNIIAQQFTVSKTKQYGVTIYKAGNTGTFVNDVIASIQSDSGSDTPSGTVLSKITIPNATWNSYATGDPIRIVFPYIVTPGVKYWVTLEQTTPDASNYPAIQSNNPASSYAGGLLKGYLPSTWTTIDADLKFFTEYSRLSEGMTVVSNGIRTNLMASSKDGLLGGAILDLDNGKWRYATGNMDTLSNAIAFASNVFSASAGGGSGTTLINGWNQNPGIYSNNDATARTLVVKVSTILPIKNARVSVGFGRATDNTVSISTDNISYTSIGNGTVSENTNQTLEIPEELVKNHTTFYIRFNKSTTSAFAVIKTFSIEADIDTSSIPLPTIYPLAVNQFSDSIKLSTAPARAYFRLNKYVNENNVMMPAIELTDSSGNPLGFGTVKQDNSQEASPVLNLLSSSTGYQQSGTGSSVTGGYLLNDGEYMTLTGTNYNFEIDYQLGTGTTAISAITKNIAYLSSNSSLADSTLDASLMANFFLSVKQQGLATAIGDAREDIQDVRGELTDVNEELDRLNGTMFIQTANQTIENTTTETSMFDGGVGSRVIPAHSLKVGDTFSMRLMGYLSGTNGDDATVKIKFGSSELVSNTSTMPATITDVYTELYYQCTVRSIGSAGTAMCQGRTMLNAGVGLATTYLRGLQMTSPVAINTETDNLIDSTYTWGTASAGNSLKVTNAVLELIKQ